MNTSAFSALSASAAVGVSPRIGILVLTYNAEHKIAYVLERIPETVWHTAEEVAVFDDASRDGTVAAVLAFREKTARSNLTVNRNPANLGYGGNQKHGYRYFMAKGFDAVVMIHGDGQHPPEFLPRLYEPLVRGEADALFGSRIMREYGGALRGGMPYYKFVGNRILTAFENRMLGLHLTEFHSGYRAYSLAALRQIDMTHMTDDFHFDTQIIIKLHHQQFRIAEIPVPTYYGDEISHVNGYKYALNVVLAVVGYRLTVRTLARYPEYAEYRAD